MSSAGLLSSCKDVGLQCLQSAEIGATPGAEITKNEVSSKLHENKVILVVPALLSLWLFYNTLLSTQEDEEYDYGNKHY